MTLYFVVRTDVTAGDGLQRVFGCCDTKLSAETFAAELRGHMVGVFAVYEGVPA